MKKLLYIFLISVLVSCTYSNDYKRKELLIQANKKFDQREFAKAIKLYDQVLAINSKDTTALYNKANTLYRLKNENNNKEEALTTYQLTDSLAQSPSFKSKNKYNSGNIQLSDKKFDKAIQLYKEALLNNPFDEEAQYNYSLALEKIDQKDNKKKNDKKDQQQKQQQKQQQNTTTTTTKSTTTTTEPTTTESTTTTKISI